jgi:hypothetical protein
LIFSFLEIYVNICVETSWKLFNQHGDAIITNTIKISRGQSSYLKLFLSSTVYIFSFVYRQLRLDKFNFLIGDNCIAIVWRKYILLMIRRVLNKKIVRDCFYWRRDFNTQGNNYTHWRYTSKWQYTHNIYSRLVRYQENEGIVLKLVPNVSSKLSCLQSFRCIDFNFCVSPAQIR